ncbi:MAG: GTPase Era [Pseudomonadota bacterium]|nr:GTPase Era [Pseudomonadota bacterium]
MNQTPKKNESHKSGFVSVVGRPNVGKSTLVNTILEEKISIVTRKPQTTRHRILGIYTKSNYQAIFVDTPGIHRNNKKVINKLMNKTALNALMDADLNLFMCEATRWTHEDEDVLSRLRKSEVPTIMLLNKIDQVHPKEALLDVISKLSALYKFESVIPIVAKRRNTLVTLLDLIPKYLPRSPRLFETDKITDRNNAFITSEKIREKLILQLNQEVPYGLTVEIEKFQESKNNITLNAVIWVEREGQKGIVVGKDGGNLKKIGTSARLDLKDYFKKSVHIDLWVKVKNNWADSKKDLQSLGYEL